MMKKILCALLFTLLFPLSATAAEVDPLWGNWASENDGSYRIFKTGYALYFDETGEAAALFTYDKIGPAVYLTNAADDSVTFFAHYKALLFDAERKLYRQVRTGFEGLWRLESAVDGEGQPYTAEQTAYALGSADFAMYFYPDGAVAMLNDGEETGAEGSFAWEDALILRFFDAEGEEVYEYTVIDENTIALEDEALKLTFIRAQ